MEKKKAKLIGNVIKLPNDSNVVKVMENIKIPRNKLWYVLVEKQDNELHMVKYNKQGVNANKFIADLKAFYINMYKDVEGIKDHFENIQVVGNENFSIIKNIPDVQIEGKKLISKITKDLITLLK
jgi:hypothetical protein